MAVAGKVTIELEAQMAQFQAAMGRATQQLDALGGKSEGTLKRIKKAFGGRSEFKEVIELFKGAGALVGLSLGFNVLADGIDGVNEHLIKMRETGVSAMDGIERSVLKAIPVIGHFADSLLNVSENWMKLQAMRQGLIPEHPETAGGGAAAEDAIRKSQSGLNKIGEKIEFDTKTLFMEEHNKRLANIEREFQETMKGINEARETEIDAIVKARGLDKILGGRKIAEGMLGGRNLDIMGRGIGAAGLRDAQTQKEIHDNAMAVAKDFKSIFDVIGGGLNKTKKDLKSLSGGVGDSVLRMFGLKDQVTIRPELLKFNSKDKTENPFISPSSVQPAREFRFTEGIPGGRGSPFDQLQRETKENTKETRENNRLQREHNRLMQQGQTSTGDSTAFQDLA